MQYNMFLDKIRQWFFKIYATTAAIELFHWQEYLDFHLILQPNIDLSAGVNWLQKIWLDFAKFTRKMKLIKHIHFFFH